MGNNANISIAMAISPKTCRSEGSLEPNNTDAKMAALKEIGAVNLQQKKKKKKKKKKRKSISIHVLKTNV